jgi:hypothetical protein
MLTEAIQDAKAEAEGRARRVLLDLYEQTMGQPDRWVLVDTLKRRLGPLSAQGVDVGIAHAELRRWVESDGPARMRQVRLTDLGRAALGLRITQRPRPSEPHAKPVVVTPFAMVRH